MAKRAVEKCIALLPAFANCKIFTAIGFLGKAEKQKTIKRIERNSDCVSVQQSRRRPNNFGNTYVLPL